jgi:hypothetical protein
VIFFNFFGKLAIDPKWDEKEENEDTLAEDLTESVSLCLKQKSTGEWLVDKSCSFCVDMGM